MSEDAKVPAGPKEFPKFVKPHESHVLRYEGERVVTPLFSEHAVSRGTGEVTVLVHDEAGEKLALAERKAVAGIPASVPANANGEGI